MRRIRVVVVGCGRDCERLPITALDARQQCIESRAWRRHTALNLVLAQRIDHCNWIIRNVGIRVDARAEANRIALDISPGLRVVVSEVVLNVIDPRRAVVQSGDFANACAELEVLEPVASVPSSDCDPGGEFFLNSCFGQGIECQESRCRGEPQRPLEHNAGIMRRGCASLCG